MMTSKVDYRPFNVSDFQVGSCVAIKTSDHSPYVFGTVQKITPKTQILTVVYNGSTWKFDKYGKEKTNRSWSKTFITYPDFGKYRNDQDQTEKENQILVRDLLAALAGRKTGAGKYSISNQETLDLVKQLTEQLNK